MTYCTIPYGCDLPDSFLLTLFPYIRINITDHLTCWTMANFSIGTQKYMPIYCTSVSDILSQGMHLKNITIYYSFDLHSFICSFLFILHYFHSFPFIFIPTNPNLPSFWQPTDSMFSYDASSQVLIHSHADPHSSVCQFFIPHSSHSLPFIFKHAQDLGFHFPTVTKLHILLQGRSLKL